MSVIAEVREDAIRDFEDGHAAHLLQVIEAYLTINSSERAESIRNQWRLLQSRKVTQEKLERQIDARLRIMPMTLSRPWRDVVQEVVDN